MHPIIIQDLEFKIEQQEIGIPDWACYYLATVKHKNGTKSTKWKYAQFGDSLWHIVYRIIKHRTKFREESFDKEFLEQHPLMLPEYFQIYKDAYMDMLCCYNLDTIDLTEDLVSLQKEINELENPKKKKN